MVHPKTSHVARVQKVSQGEVISPVMSVFIAVSVPTCAIGPIVENNLYNDLLLQFTLVFIRARSPICARDAESHSVIRVHWPAIDEFIQANVHTSALMQIVKRRLLDELL